MLFFPEMLHAFDYDSIWMAIASMQFFIIILIGGLIVRVSTRSVIKYFYSL